MSAPTKKKSDRRGDITRSLYRCIARQGYANIKFNDIAAEAGMSPSHLGYYFENKAAILLFYSEALCRKNIENLPALTALSTEKQIEKLVKFCFSPSMMNENLMGVIKELNGLAVHDAALFKIKSNHTHEWKTYLKQFFQRAKVKNPREASTKAHAMLVGLNTDVLFDHDLSLKQATKIFRSTLEDLCKER